MTDGLPARRSSDNLMTKKDSTLDLLTVVLDKVMVKFKVGECIAYDDAGMISFKVLYIRGVEFGPE